MSVSGQTLNDRLLAAKHSLAGQGLAKAVCKATTEELMAPKKKHLEYLRRCTEEPNVSIPTLAGELRERTASPNWIVAFKSLVTTHHLMCHGHERFCQFLASSNCDFHLSPLLDKGGGVQVGPITGHDMSPFVRRYALYLAAKTSAYRSLALDLCKARRDAEGSCLRQMGQEKLLKTLGPLEKQIDKLLDFEATSQDLNNGAINAAFVLLFRDLIRLFACYNDGIINLLSKYFQLGRREAQEALEFYKAFLVRTDRVAEFLKVAERFGIDKNDIPDLAKAPSSLLEAMEAHLASLGGPEPKSAPVEVVNKSKKGSKAQTATNPFFGGGAATANEEEETPDILDILGMKGDANNANNNAVAANPFAQATNNAQPDEPNALGASFFSSMMPGQGVAQ